jgi:hypothetical protein
MRKTAWPLWQWRKWRWIAAFAVMGELAACNELAAPVEEAGLALRNCRSGECEPPPDPTTPPEEPPPSNLPHCPYACSSSAPCGRRCYDPGLAQETSCGGWGQCEACSPAVCGGPTDCRKQCRTGGGLMACNAWSFGAMADADLDSVPDALELELARRYFPTLRLRTSSINGSPQGDWGQLYSGGAFPTGDWQFVVRPVTAWADYTQMIWNRDTDQYDTIGSEHRCDPGQCLEIVYIIPYNWDLGDTLSVGSHRGDAELYAVLVARKDPAVRVDGVSVPPRWDVPWEIARNDPGAWRGHSELASAHMCATADSSVYRFNHIRPETGVVTRLWVAEGKHANYFSQAACDAGACKLGVCWDNCDQNDFDMVFNQQFTGAGPLRNAGEEACHAHPTFDTFTPAPGLSPTQAPGGAYDVWSGLPFGSDVEGRGTALLRAGTMLWWKKDKPYVCWPRASDPPPPPPPPPGSPPPSPCPRNQRCCEPGPNGTCDLCAPASAQCP